MITKWTVSNFKSIVKETSLDLAPLTIFAGPNSSGKSTVLQGILLISQTLADKVGSRPIVLNGSLMHMGQFDDLRSFNTEYAQISFGWECRPALPVANMTSGEQRMALVYGGDRTLGLIMGISCRLSFDAPPGAADRDLYQLHPQVFLFDMSVLARRSDNTDHRQELTVLRSPDPGAKFAGLVLETADALQARAGLDYDISTESELGDYYGDLEIKPPEIVGCVLRHFLPERLSLRVNVIEERAAQLHMLLTDNALMYPSSASADFDDVIPESVLAMVRERYVQMGADMPAFLAVTGDMPIENYMNHAEDDMQPDEKAVWMHVIGEWEDLQHEIASALRSVSKSAETEPELDARPEFELLTERLPTNFRAASRYLTEFFSSSVKYLGPLRNEPKPLYPLAAQADPTDVGLRGEMTAAVLNLHRERRIHYIPSAAFTQTPFNPSQVPRSLEAAVIDWLKYLDVAENVQSADLGKLGHEMKVAMSEDGPKQDLTHVGVGVSQVLPILVMSLLAERDTTLIFEQPELHLHPKVQTRLGDFFLSIALSGKQCLIETHSEYLINRLRYRAASEGARNRVTGNMKVYFVEKLDGASSFREVKVNDYGAIQDWPEGFFDQNTREAEDILRAAMKKRRAERSSGGAHG